MEKEPKIGLALSSGAARGLAHIGVMKVLEKENISVEFIAGSSMGALVGALYAVGINPRVMECLAVSLDKRKWVDWKLSGLGAMGGKKVEEFLRLLIRDKEFQDLHIALTVVATDLIKGELVNINQGPLMPAVMASIAVPGIFPPVQYSERMLVDGGVLCRVPIQQARALGADVVVGVDVGGHIQEAHLSNFFDVVSQSISIMGREIMKDKLLKADIMIYPDVSGIGLTQFQKAQVCIEEGEKAARKVMPMLRSLL